jgi:hypothetical protein
MLALLGVALAAATAEIARLCLKAGDEAPSAPAPPVRLSPLEFGADAADGQPGFMTL